jgi:hypothetical protein
MDPSIQKARAATFPYDGDLAARREMCRRLAAVGRRRDAVPYAQLVKGMHFQIFGVLAGKPFELGVPDWIDLHRVVLGNYLGRISCDTYELGGFMASAVAVSQSSGEPSDGFRSLLVDLGLVGSKKSADCTAIWLDHLNRAYDWFALNPAWQD